MLSGPEAFWTVADRLVTAAEARLEPAPGRACVVPGGEIARDDCCAGQLAAAITRIFPSETFPFPAAGRDARTGARSPCGPPVLAAEITLEIVRCVHVQDDQGRAPSCAALGTDAKQVERDRYQVWAAAVCLLQGMRGPPSMDIYDWQLVDQPSVGPEGGCAGSALNLIVGLDNLCPCT